MITSSQHISEIGGKSWGVLRLPDESDKKWSAFNPSISRNPNGELRMTVRSSNYIYTNNSKNFSLTVGGKITNRLWFCDVDEKTLEIYNLRELTINSPLPLRRGVEDARLYWRNNRWEMTGVILETHTPKARIWTFWIDIDNNVANFIEALEGPYPERIEKNWLPTSGEPTDKFDFIYNTVSVYKDGQLQRFKDASEEYLQIRGGSPLIRDGDFYISVTHRVEQESYYEYNTATFGMGTKHVRSYYHQFVKWTLDGKLHSISNDFIFHEGGIEYAAGLVKIKEDYVISFGRKDCASWFCRVPVKNITFNPIRATP